MLSCFIAKELSLQCDINATITEMHNLAYFYHWSREECWNIPCTERRIFCDKLRRQLKAETSGYTDNNTQSPSKYKESK